MVVQEIVAQELGLDNLGKLNLYSGWTTPLGFNEVHHTVIARVLYVEPRRVLYWDAQPDRQNSPKRFAHMLRWRGVAPLSDPEAYHDSLNDAVALHESSQPPEKRLSTLLAIAGRYQREAAHGQRITRLATSTARILFNYEPPSGTNLTALHSHLLDLIS